ncbi:unnamed protein product [Cochlearia groenlandica]
MPNTKEAKALPGQSSPSRQCRTQKKPRHRPDNPVHQGKAEHKRSQGIARTIQSIKAKPNTKEAKALPGQVRSIKAKPNTKEAKALPGQSSPSRQSRTQKKPRHCPDNLVHQGNAEHKRSQGIARTIKSIKAKPNTKETKALPGRVPSIKAKPKSKLKFG